VAVRGMVPLALVAGCGRYGFSGGADAGVDSTDAPPVSTAMVTIDTSRLTATATDFPLPIFVRGHYAYDPAAGVIVSDAAGNPLPIEIDEDVVWVRTTLPPGPSASLKIEFGVMGTASSVWAPSYEGVWHMSPGAVSHDSSIHNRDGELHGTAVGVGMLGSARTFAGSIADYITVTPPMAIALPQLTASGWMYLNALTQPGFYETIITSEHLDSTEDDYLLGIDTGNDPIGNVYIGSSYPSRFSTVETTALWIHLVVVYDGSIVTVYRNNQAGTPATTPGGPVATTTYTIYMGADRNNNTGTVPPNVPDVDFLNGALDEVRLESVARPVDWLGFEDAAMRDQVITYGARN